MNHDNLYKENYSKILMIKIKPKGYIQVTKEVLEEAIRLKEGRRAEGYGDDKHYVSLEQMTCLIGAGAGIINLNNKEGSGFVHEVIYKDHIFVTASERPYAPNIHPSLCF